MCSLQIKVGLGFVLFETEARGNSDVACLHFPTDDPSAFEPSSDMPIKDGLGLNQPISQTASHELRITQRSSLLCRVFASSLL